MIRNANDRRWKQVSLDPQMVMGLFLPWGYEVDCFPQLAFDPAEIPHDFTIDRVWGDVLGHSIHVLVYHPSFAIVDLASLPPHVSAQVTPVWLPKCRDRTEALKLGTWMYKTEQEHLRDFFSSIKTEG